MRRTNWIRRPAAERILALSAAFLFLICPVRAAGEETVAVGGMPFGVRFAADGVVVVGFTEVETEAGRVSPASDAGLRVNDVITAVDGIDVRTAEEVRSRIEEGDGILSVTYLRDGTEATAEVCPVLSEKDGRRRAGMWIRDTMAGIGTVTYLIPETGEFGGLGHGICAAESGELLNLERGRVTDVIITGVEKGAPGTPGELRGIFTGAVLGKLTGNTDCGVFGVYDVVPEGRRVAIADRSEVRLGRASMLCTVDGQSPREYEVMITAINRRSRDNRSFSVAVTDRELLERTGGIVQGMSGSPILQDGRLIGAVTHVLVGDPAEGYGIFIDNMFTAATVGLMAPAAAGSPLTADTDPQ